MNIKKEFCYILKRVIIAVIIILIMAFIDSKIPKALTLKNGNILSNNISGYDNVKNGAYFKNNIDFSSNFDFSFTISGNNNVSGYDYISFNLYQFYLYDSTVNLQNGEYQPAENTEYYCTQWALKQTTYADGSQSNYYVCEIWAPSSNSSTYTTTTYGYIDEVPEIGFSVYAIYQDNTYSNCEFDTKNYGSNLITCKISDTATNITSLRFRGVTAPYYAAITGQLGITSYYTAWKDPSSSSAAAIINNQNQNQQQAHQDAQETNNTIKDSSIDSNNASNTISSVSSLLPSDNSISNLLGLPITFVQSINNGINGTCAPIHLFDLKMSELENSSASDWSFTLPCVDLSSILGNTWIIIDTIMSALIVYAMAKYFIRLFIKLTQMDTYLVEEAYK